MPETGSASYRHVAEASEIREVVQDYEGTPGQVFIFQGVRCLTTRPPHPYVLTSDGKIPLFAADDVDSDIDANGNLAVAPEVVDNGDEVEPDEDDEAQDDDRLN